MSTSGIVLLKHKVTGKLYWGLRGTSVSDTWYSCRLLGGHEGSSIALAPYDVEIVQDLSKEVIIEIGGYRDVSFKV